MPDLLCCPILGCAIGSGMTLQYGIPRRPRPRNPDKYPAFRPQRALRGLLDVPAFAAPDHRTASQANGYAYLRRLLQCCFVIVSILETRDKTKQLTVNRKVKKEKPNKRCVEDLHIR